MRVAGPSAVSFEQQRDDARFNDGNSRVLFHLQIATRYYASFAFSKFYDLPRFISPLLRALLSERMLSSQFCILLS